jgi:hypothetical protein
MKKFLLFILIASSLSCNKILGKTCWECEVTRRDGTTYREKVCNKDENYFPQFTDANGNDLNAFCEKR